MRRTAGLTLKNVRIPSVFQRRPTGNERVVIVFTRPTRDVARLNVATGPCVAPPGRKRPLVGVTNQEPGDESRYETLFELLLDKRVVGPWESTASAGEGRLHIFSNGFVDALAEINREVVRRSQARPEDYDWMFGPSLDLAERWLVAVRWPYPTATAWAWLAENWAAPVAGLASPRTEVKSCTAGQVRVLTRG